MSQAQSENCSQYEGILEWVTGIARAAALGMGVHSPVERMAEGTQPPAGDAVCGLCLVSGRLILAEPRALKAA